MTTTGRPDLVSAQTLSTGRDVDVCFDKQIATTSTILQTAQNNLGKFLWIAGYRAHNELNPTAVNLDQSNNKCVVASFPSAVATNQASPSPTSNGIDQNQYTILTIAQGAVTSVGTNGENIDDSTTLVPYTAPGSASRNGTHNGTTGLTTAPDLVGTSPGPSVTGPPAFGPTNSVVFTFDQNVATASASDFFIVSTQGEVCHGVAIIGTVGQNVDVAFPQTGPGSGGTGCAGANGATPSNYVRDGVFQNGVNSAADTGSYNGLEGTAAASAVNSGATGLPDLKSASLLGNGNTVEYVFDKPVTANLAADFEVILSPALSGGLGNSGESGAILHATNVTGGGVPNSIDATFSCNSGGPGTCLGGAPSGPNSTNGTNLQNENEYAVIAAVQGQAANDVGSNGVPDRNSEGDTNVPGSAPIGDNAGAFGNGYTTAADAYAVNINRANGVVTVFLDQRVSFCDPSDIHLIRNDGTDVGQPTASSGASGCNSATGVIIPGYAGGSADSTYPAPGPEAITMQFSSAQTSTAAGLQLLDDAFETPLFDENGNDPNNTCNNNNATEGCQDYESVAQALAPVGSAAHLKAAKVHRTAKAHKKTRVHKTHKKSRSHSKRK